MSRAMYRLMTELQKDRTASGERSCFLLAMRFSALRAGSDDAEFQDLVEMKSSYRATPEASITECSGARL